MQTRRSSPLKLRIAGPEDSSDIWEWRNDPKTRSMFRNSATVPWASHSSWYASALMDKRKSIFVGIESESGLKIGVVRFDRESIGDVAEISINLNPAMRGKGFSEPLLSLAIAKFLQNSDCVLLAEVKAENTASAQIFEKVGFNEYAEEHGMKKFRKSS